MNRGKKRMNNDPDEWSQKLAAARNSQVPFALHNEGDSEEEVISESSKDASYSLAESLVRWIDRYLEGRINRHTP